MMKLDRKMMEALAKRKCDLNQWILEAGELEEEGGDRLDHWHEGCLIGKSNELTHTLLTLGVYDEVIDIVVLMGAGEYWTQEEIDELHEEAIGEYEEYITEDWINYTEQGGTKSFESWVS